MSKYENPLNNLRIASPCSADWNAMQGDDRKRFCGECKLNVYNLSGMTKYDAEHLLRMSEGRLCVRYYQRADGTVLTKDCPVGWARVKQRVTLMATAAFSLVMSLFAAMFVVSVFKKTTTQPLMGAVALKPTPTPTPKKTTVLMGEIAGPEQIMGKPVAPKPATRKATKVYRSATLSEG